MDYKSQKMCNNSTEPSAMENRNISEYRMVYHVLDELGFSNFKGTFSENQIRDSTLTYIESEEELKVLLKEIGLPAGPVFAFVKLWFRYKDNISTDKLEPTKKVHEKPIKELDDKNTQTDNLNTSEVCTQTRRVVDNQYPHHLPDPYEMFRSYPSFPYHLPAAMTRMSLPSNYAGVSSWPYNMYPSPTQYNSTEAGDIREIQDVLVQNGLDSNSYDPLENFCPHDNDDSSVVPLEENGCDVAVDNDTTPNMSNEYALFPNTEPLCSPKSPVDVNFVNEKDDAMISRILQAEQDREQKSYATALKDHKEGQHSLPSSTHSDLVLSPSASRSRSSSTASANNLSRSTSSNDFHPLSPTRKTHEVPMKSPPNRPYVGIDDIDPQQRPMVTKSKTISSLTNPTFNDFFDNLPETPEYIEATKEKNVKAGWRPHSGKHEKTGRRLEFKPQYIDKDGRVRHGVRVRGALKSMECWLHTNNKPPIECLFAHSRIGDTLEFICIRCTYEKPRHYECRDKKGHQAFVCNLGAYRAINGEKWRSKGESS